MKPSDIAKLITENLNENNGLITEWGEDTIRQRAREIAAKLGIIKEIDDETIAKIRALLATSLGGQADIEKALNPEQLDDVIKQVLIPPKPVENPAQRKIPQDPQRWTTPRKEPGYTSKEKHYFRRMSEE